jgi:mediator of RNA polymerase II transcription subunit 14
MKFEVHPELVTQNNLKWSISLCLTIPPVAPNVFPVGQAGIICNKEKFLIFMHLTRCNIPPGQDPVSIVVPIVYNTTANQTSLASLQRELNGPALHAVQQHLMRWNASNMNPGRCSILPAIHDLLMNLALPNEAGFTMGTGPPPPGMVPAAMGQPPSGMSQPPSGIGQPPAGMGQPPSSMGQPPVSMGQAPTGMGYSQREP